MLCQKTPLPAEEDGKHSEPGEGRCGNSDYPTSYTLTRPSTLIDTGGSCLT